MSYRREITTLGRGGSDTTAVALAAALGADCEIYSDVDGVYSADPRVVPEARRLDEIGYEAMQELAEHGAKVLNAQAVEWARKAQIVIHARATAGGGGETRIVGAPKETRGALAVTGCKRVTMVTGGDALRVLEEERAAVRHACAACVRLVRDDVPDWPRVERRLAEAGARVVEIGEVTVVGPGMGDPQAVRRALAAARGVTGADVAEWDSTPLRLTLIVPPALVDDVTRAVHAALC